ncbi:MAG: hypothetical protein ABW175_18900 [Bradyrhizobium sp.]
MASNSFVEIVSHFAGYLHIFHDIARDRIHYDDSLASRPTDDYTTLRPDFDDRVAPDDMEILGSPAPDPIPEALAQFARARPLKLLRESEDGEPDLSPRPVPPSVPMPKPVGGGGGGADHHVHVQYQDGGEQTQLTIHQFNFMHDDDVHLSPDAQTAVAPQLAQLNSDVLLTIEQLAADAADEIPAGWQISQTDGAAAQFAAAHDLAWAERGGTADAHSVTPDYYVNGAVQERPSGAAAPTEPPEPPDTGHGIGQWASMGDNFIINAALVVDMGEGARTMVVKGDYFKTDAIFQTNTIVDHDRVDLSGHRSSGGHQESSPDDANVVKNIADFARNPSIYTDFAAQMAGPNWIVNVVDGDYYSVHAMAQVNLLSDNDVATQVSSNSHYNLVGGFNTQGNLAQLFDGSIEYDLIIIKGSYHGLNVIFQNNILLDNDRIVMSGDGGDADRSAESGGNDLLNEAAIANYGGATFEGLPAHLSLIQELLDAGMTSLDPELAGALIGHGGPLRVLYVTGDYYDINALWQTNVTADVDVMVQLQNQPAADLLARDPDAVVTQSVTTGGNQLHNDAAIVDVNPNATYVGGHVYSDSILVQADLVPKGADHAVNADTHSLVTELIAFVDDAHQTAAPPPVVSPMQSDPMASMLH